MRRLAVTFGALLGLTSLTLGLSFVPLGAWALPLALGIAAAKAGLVAAVFMHLAERPFTLKLVFATAVGMVLVLVGLSVADVMTRGG